MFVLSLDLRVSREKQHLKCVQSEISKLSRSVLFVLTVGDGLDIHLVYETDVAVCCVKSYSTIFFNAMKSNDFMGSVPR